MSVTERLDGAQRRHPVLGFPLAVVYKFVDDQGSYLAVLITYYGFLSLFPLLLLLTSVLGFVLGGDAYLQQRVLNSTLSQFPVIGLLGAVYGGLGVAQAGQNAMNTAWHVPRNNRPGRCRGDASGGGARRRPGWRR
jgi:membrane protein